MALKTIIHIPSGEFKDKTGYSACGPFEPNRPILSTSPQGVDTIDPDYAIVVVPRIPDPLTEKWDGSAIVAKTQAERDASKAAQLASKAQRTSREKDILAMLAVIVRQKNVSAWNALTSQQKVTAVLAEADLFKTFREFIDDKV